MRKLYKQPTKSLNSWDWDAKPRERVFRPMPLGGAYIYDLRESNGRNKAAMGELTPILVKKNGVPRIAIKADDGLWYWID